MCDTFVYRMEAGSLFYMLTPGKFDGDVHFSIIKTKIKEGKKVLSAKKEEENKPHS